MFCRSHRWGKFPWFFPRYFVKKEISIILSCCFFTVNGFLKKCLFHRERYLGTLLQVEGMLKTWFPHIAAQKSSLGNSRHQLTKVRTCKTEGGWGNKETKCTCRNGFLLLFSLESFPLLQQVSFQGRECLTFQHCLDSCMVFVLFCSDHYKELHEV